MAALRRHLRFAASSPVDPSRHLLPSAVRFQSSLSQQFAAPPTPPADGSSTAPLSRLPTASLLRALALHSVTRKPWLLSLGTKVMLKSAGSIDNNRLLKWLVDKSFYAHFCAGATPEQISRTVSSLRDLGYSGIILAYAREVEPSSDVGTSGTSSSEIAQWLSGTLKTIELTLPGDFVAIKLTGAGAECLPLLLQQRPCTDVPALSSAIEDICTAASKRGVKLLVDAEQAALQAGIDRWSLQQMRRYNTGPSAVIYNTYQMYLRRSPQTLQNHADLAAAEGWRLGVKLVRGAYLHTDPRELVHPTKAATDAAYNDAAAMLIRTGVDTVLASHNRESVMRALTLRRREGGAGALVFAQLMGMADELSLSLVGEEGAKVLKYAVWGSTGECVKYLLRRAEENQDAVSRSDENRYAVMDELKRRVMS